MTSLSQPKTVFEVLKYAQQILKDIEDVKTDCEILLCDVLRVKRAYLPIIYDKVITKNQFLQYEKYIKRRLKREPVAYILGNCEFYNCNLIVNSNVLIPRCETELLVEQSIKISKEKKYKTVLDLCCGSGCIAIALSKFSNFKNITAVDVSKEALSVAKQNAKNNNAKVDFVLSNLFKKIYSLKFDMIVSNPPYVSKNEYENLSKELFFEPKIALLAQDDGLYFYNHIAKNFLNGNGCLMLELSATKSQEIKKIFENEKYKDIKIIKDYSNLDRILKAGI